MTANRIPFKPSRRYKGYAIPFTVVWEKGQEHPDFKHIDAEKVKLCLDKSLCGICGKKMHGSRAWIASMATDYLDPRGWFSDPPMHIACAEYSLTACPYLSRPRIRADTPDNTVPDTGAPSRILVGVGVKRTKADPTLSRAVAWIHTYETQTHSNQG